jgi:hypothetical protein
MGRLMRRASLGALVGLLAVVLVPAAGVRAADPVFGTPTIDAAFGEGVELTQPVRLDEIPFRVELLVTVGTAPPLVIETAPPTTTGEVVLRGTYAEGHILPNTPVEARWRITPTPDGDPVTGPSASTVYADDRFAWQTVSGDVVRVHWYEGSQAFAERALDIGETAVRETAALLGVTEDEPVDFFIYADQAAFYDALGPGTRENVGGQANADIRTLFALITPNEIDDPWVGVVIPHELVHLVFDTAVQNPYHFPPRWLNEGLATYLSEGYTAGYRADVERAAGADALIPLDGLGGQFPTTPDGFFLAYAESVSAVDFLIRTHGQDALLTLIDAYADGRTDDEAFQLAIGQDVAAFDAAWLGDLGMDVPARVGPVPAPAGPRPADWGPGGASPLPGATSGTGPAVTPVPAPGGEPAPSGIGAGAALPVLIVAGLLGLACVGLVLARRGGRPTSS